MERYSRNILIEEIGIDGQKRINSASVLVVGAGGLGSPVLLYLAAAGIGTLGIVDYDRVDITNLQRQIIHNSNNVNILKTESAKAAINVLNHEVRVNIVTEKFSVTNAQQIVRDYDFVIDCCDSYTCKYLINDICVKEKIPYSHGAVTQLRGEIMTYTPGNACYRCLFDTPPVSNTKKMEPEGILGSIAGVIGSLQATEALKYITGAGTLLTNRLLVFDGKNMLFHQLKIAKNKLCNCSKL
ncbi:MAG: HesA/MoeB/ThiF family protein [Cytophagaceae bacterium]|jgi:molybdopterin/thiamine biosynthesis adenylyltransferase|nr:HesA/MoeB/ThiF family protein [Cytophagaceae bacterium]